MYHFVKVSPVFVRYVSSLEIVVTVIEQIVDGMCTVVFVLWARLIRRSSLYEHITPMLKDLHYLQSLERIDFELAVLVYWCLHGLAPQYLSDYIRCVADSNRHRLRSSSSSQLVIRCTWLSTIGDGAFPMAGSHLWNSLPPDVTSAPTLTFFGTASKPTFSPDHFLTNCFRFIVLYTVYSSGLAVLYLGHSK